MKPKLLSLYKLFILPSQTLNLDPHFQFTLMLLTCLSRAHAAFSKF